jgi:thiamine pyrophosphate-dependent acetolactate synthase large subunit-like protein
MRFRDRPPHVQTSVAELPHIHWPTFAAALGVTALAATSTDTLLDAIHRAATAEGPVLVDIHTRPGDDPPFAANSFSSAAPAFRPPAFITPP